MKKILILSLSFVSFSICANDCPQLEGNYMCVDPLGKLYTNNIKQTENSPITYKLTKENKPTVDIITDYEERSSSVTFDNRPFRRTIRSSCSGGALLYEFILTDGLQLTIRGNSQFEKTKDGYKKINKLFLPFDRIEESREDCRKKD